MIKFVFKFFALMPLRLNHFIGKGMGRLLYLTNNRSKSVVSKNIDICFPDLDERQQQDLIKKSLIETGKSLSESGFIWFNSFEHSARHVVKMKGEQHFKTEQSIILLAPHFGCWEVVLRVASLYRTTTCMYKELSNKKQNALLLSVREQQNLFMVTANNKGVLKLQRALKNDQLVIILPDQYPGEEKGVLAPFFGQNIRTMTLLVKLARKNNAKVLLTWATRLDKGRGYELNIEPVDVLSKSGVLAEDVAKMNQVIENLVKTKPEQYLWNYKRFKGVTKY
ncbi:Lipid A biosynthesis lauroyl acyltransferase (EC [Bathymodiolus brooksi thiotrophic gill symbiont]|nr:Lipid A biosynthesis lauroyl acyltransferase (EC [Bathymodiolus brooksi thiotrophic gill symbiont]